MRDSSSRREFLASGIALPAAALTPTLLSGGLRGDSTNIVSGWKLRMALSIEFSQYRLR